MIYKSFILTFQSRSIWIGPRPSWDHPRRLNDDSLFFISFAIFVKNMWFWSNLDILRKTWVGPPMEGGEKSCSDNWWWQHGLEKGTAICFYCHWPQPEITADHLHRHFVNKLFGVFGILDARWPAPLQQLDMEFLGSIQAQLPSCPPFKEYV